MYAYGVLLWEMLTRRVPWEGLTTLQIAVRVALERFQLPVGGEAFEGVPARLQKLLQACFAEDPKRRPSADEAAKVLMLMLRMLVPGSPHHQGAEPPADGTLSASEATNTKAGAPDAAECQGNPEAQVGGSGLRVATMPPLLRDDDYSVITEPARPFSRNGGQPALDSHL